MHQTFSFQVLTHLLAGMTSRSRSRRTAKPHHLLTRTSTVSRHRRLGRWRTGNEYADQHKRNDALNFHCVLP